MQAFVNMTLSLCFHYLINVWVVHSVGWATSNPKLCHGYAKQAVCSHICFVCSCLSV